MREASAFASAASHRGLEAGAVLQMLELAEVSTNWITGVEAAGQMKGMSLGRGSRIHGAFAVLLMASAVVVMLVMAFRG